MSRIVNFDLAAHIELQGILSKSKSFYEVYDAVRNSRGILGRMADDNRGDSKFWADVADLYDGRAEFSTRLIYVIDIKINGTNTYLSINKKVPIVTLVNTIDSAIKLSLEGINDMNPKLVKFAVPVSQKTKEIVCGKD